MLVIEEIQKIKREKLGLVTVVTGEDVGQFQQAKDVLLEKIGFDASDLGFAYFDLSEADYAQVDLDLVSLPFFADEKVVILDYFADLTTDKKRHLTDEELKQFEAYLENPSDTTRLIIFASGKLDSKRRLVKLLKRDAQIFETAPLKEAELRQYFSKKISQAKLEMAPDVYEQLLLASNFDFSEMTKNIAFLSAYKPQGTITAEDIRAAIPKTLQDNLFDLMQFVLKSQVDEARSLVQDLRLQGEDEVKLIAILLGQFRLLLQVKMLQEQGRGEAQIVSDLSEIVGRKVNPYQVKYALRDSRGLALSFLKEILAILIETDYQIKTGVNDKDYLFDVALLKMMRG